MWQTLVLIHFFPIVSGQFHGLTRARVWVKSDTEPRSPVSRQYLVLPTNYRLQRPKIRLLLTGLYPSTHFFDQSNKFHGILHQRPKEKLISPLCTYSKFTKICVSGSSITLSTQKRCTCMAQTVAPSGHHCCGPGTTFVFSIPSKFDVIIQVSLSLGVIFLFHNVILF